VGEALDKREGFVGNLAPAAVDHDECPRLEISAFIERRVWSNRKTLNKLTFVQTAA
jgi:hypothetical protein